MLVILTNFVCFIYIYIYIYIYLYIINIIIKTMCPSGYDHNGFVPTYALGHMMYGYTLLVLLNIYMYIYIFIYIYILLWKLYMPFI